MSTHSTCPFCNSVLPATSTGDPPTACPRCGESIARTGQPATASPTATAPARSPWRAPIIAFVVLLLACGAFLIWNQRAKSRRTQPASHTPHTVVRPADMPGLGYLPESCEAVFAVQLPILLKQLGPGPEEDPAKALEDLGIPESVVTTIENASGVGLKNVDQLVVGIGFQKGSLPPQLVVVVHTRQPYDFDSILRKAKATSLKRNDRKLHVVRSSPVPNVYWWSPNDRVLVGTIAARDFDEVPVPPHTGIGHLRTEVAALVREHVADDASAWFVASSDRWAQYLSPYILLPISPLQGRKDLVKPAERLRSVALSIPSTNDGTVDVQIELKTAQAGEGLRAALADRFRSEPIEVSGEGGQCRVQTPFEPRRIASIVSRLIQEGK